MGKVEKYIRALEELGDGRYHYYDGRANGIGCSEYTRLALLAAGIIEPEDSFHAASGREGILGDSAKFRKLAWDPTVLQTGDILWSNGHHVATWDGGNGVYEAAPEVSHGICANGRTGVGHWPNHTAYNCGTGSNSWTCIYRIIDADEVKETLKEATGMDKTSNLAALIGFLPVIKRGSTGTAVKALQAILSKYGWYSDTIDGQAGPNTIKGIKLLQTALGVTVDGCVDQIVWKKLLT